MIPAKPARGFTWWFARHARSRLFRAFGRVQVAGLGALREALERGPVLVIANHTTWWDPLVALWLSQVELRADAYAMMDADNLRRLPFFAMVGGFGVDLRDRRDGARSIRYAARLLDRPGRLVWIYPEGRERSPFADLELRPGAGAVARLAGCPVIPVATRFVFAAAEKPELWISIGRPVTDGDLAAALRREIDRVDRAIDVRTEAAVEAEGFDVLHRTAAGTVERLAERALVRLTRVL